MWISGVKDDDMQIRSKAYLQLILLWRSLHNLIPPHDDDASSEASPSLMYTAVVLAFLLAILEVDLHQDELQSFGLVKNDYRIEPVFMSP
jgi:hypothetical protein